MRPDSAPAAMVPSYLHVYLTLEVLVATVQKQDLLVAALRDAMDVCWWHMDEKARAAVKR